MLVFTTNIISPTRHDFFQRLQLRFLSVQNYLPDHTDKIILNKGAFDGWNVESRLWSWLGQTCSRSLIVFLSHFLVILLIIWLILAYTLAQDFWRIYSLGRNLVQCSRIHFTFVKFMKNLFSTKNRIFIYLVGPSNSGKTYLIHECLNVGIFQLKFNKIWLFNQLPQPLCDVKQKAIDNLEFFQSVEFQFINSLKSNCTTYLLLFVDSFAEIRNPKDFVDIATAGRHRQFSTIYINHNFSHQKNFGWDVEIQNTHIVFFQVTSRCASSCYIKCTVGAWINSLWLVSGWNVCSFFGHLLIDLSARTDDRLRYCTNCGNGPSKFYVHDNLKQLKHLDDEHTKSLYSASIPTLVPRMQKSVYKICPKDFIRFISECIVNLLQGNLSEVKKVMC